MTKRSVEKWRGNTSSNEDKRMIWACLGIAVALLLAGFAFAGEDNPGKHLGHGDATTSDTNDGNAIGQRDHDGFSADTYAHDGGIDPIPGGGIWNADSHGGATGTSGEQQPDGPPGQIGGE